MDRSGWCMKLPVSDWNRAEHEKCPEHFQTRSCACECGHVGSRALADRGMTFEAVKPKRPVLDT